MFSGKRLSRYGLIAASAGIVVFVGEGVKARLELSRTGEAFVWLCAVAVIGVACYVAARLKKQSRGA